MATNPGRRRVAMSEKQMYPRDPLEDRFKRDVCFRQLVGLLDNFLQQHEFSPSELRDACMLASTRYEMRNNRQRFVLDDREIEAFLRGTQLTPEELLELERRSDSAFAQLLRDNPSLRLELEKNR